VQTVTADRPAPPEPTAYTVLLRTRAKSIAFLTLMSALAATMAITRHEIILVVPVGVLTLFLVVTVILALRPRPYVVLSVEGLTYNYNEFLAWPDVRAVSVHHRGHGGRKGPGISVEQHETWPIRLRGVLLPVPVEEVVEAMRRYHPELVVKLTE
jgi:hypothetical protein